MRETLLRQVSSLVALTASAMAQVQMRAIAATPLAVSSGAANQTLPQNTDVTTGASLSAGTLAQLVFTPSRPGGISLVLSASASGSYSSMISSSAGGTVKISLSSPTRVRVRIAISLSGTIGAFGGGISQAVDIPGVGNLSLSSSGHKAQTFGAWLEAAGLVIQETIQAYGPAQASHYSGGSGSGTTTILIDADADYPWKCTPYGTPWGASLSPTVDFAVPGTTLLTVSDYLSFPTAAWMLLGTQAVAVPVLGCVLYSDGVVQIPLAVDPLGRAYLRLPAGPLIGLQLYAQGVILVGTAVHASAGLKLTGT